MPGPGPRLVLGLGNPGQEYEGSRHNLGFEVVDLLAARAGLSFRKSGRSVVARGTPAAATAAAPAGRVAVSADGAVPFVLAKPQTFMNNSGRAARELLAELDEGTELLVVCDDFHLPLGRLRCRASGSDGGQKGLASVIALLAPRPVPRLRLGIDEPPQSVPAEDYVLRRFKRAEQPAARAMIERAADCVADWLAHGNLSRLVNACNAPPPD